MRHLLLRLEGPMMSFGDVRVDEKLPTARFPAQSMVCGLIANAMGVDKSEHARLQDLQAAMSIASRLDRPGHLMRDYQTALLNSTDAVWTSRGRIAVRDGGSKGEFTVQIEKWYLADASVTVAVALPDSMMDNVADALNYPARPLFLGRAACPPSRPVLLGLFEANDVLDALRVTPRDHGIASTMEAQWPRHLAAGAGTREILVSDLKDWRNRVHVGARRVSHGHITVGAAQ